MKNTDDRDSPSAESRQPTATTALPHLRQLLDDYLRMYANRDDRLTAFFSKDFSGFTGGGDFLVKDLQEWVAITRLDFSQVKDALRLELKDVAIQPLSETIAVATSFFTIHLPIKDHILSRETARLVLIFRQESEGWKITHSSISIPYQGVRTGEVYPLQDLMKRNRFLEEQVAERTSELSAANENLNRTNEELANEIAEHERTGRQLHELLSSRTQELREATAAALRAGADEEDRIGKELHDNLCPDLIGLARQAETLADAPALPGQMRAQLRDLATKASAAARRARNLSHLLARPDFIHASFSELLHAQLNHLEKTLDLTCELTLDDALPALNSEQSDHLVRIIREAVVNAARHAGARRIWVDCVKFGSRATVSISNNGRLLPPPEILTTGLGLRQMQMRADQLEATLALRPGQAGGAVVELTFLLPTNELNFDPTL
jgi:signal transduction histidine kinase